MLPAIPLRIRFSRVVAIRFVRFRSSRNSFRPGLHANPPFQSSDAYGGEKEERRGRQADERRKVEEEEEEEEEGGGVYSDTVEGPRASAVKKY